jgi:hypothetical protein
MFERVLKKELFLFKLSTLFLLLIFLFLLILQFSGCENSTEGTSTYDAKGKVYSIFNVPLSGLQVTAGGKSTVTDVNGAFNIPQILLPMNVSILDTAIRKCIYISKSTDFISNSMAIPSINSIPELIPSYIYATYPNGLLTSGGKIIFTDFKDKNFNINASASGGTLCMHMAPGTQYKGSVIVLLFTKDNNDHIVSYDRYCIKPDITVNPGDAVNLNLLASEFKTNTRDTVYHVTYNPVQGQTVDMRYSYITFSSRHTTDYLIGILFESFSSNSFDVVAPLGLDIRCSPLVGFESHDNANNSSEVYYSLNGDITLNAPAPPELVSPANNASVDINSEIIFNQGSGGPVFGKFYKLYLYETTGTGKTISFEIYIEKEKFLLSELNNLGFGSVKGKTFSWSVELYDKEYMFNNLSDGLANNYKTSSRSGTRVFTINP